MLALKKKGFTLIEIVIVLAIAALILVIVFLAVGGAQRSQRDNASKDAASRVIAAYTTYLGDNSNKAPTTDAQMSTYLTDVKDARGNVPTISATAFSAAAKTDFRYTPKGTCASGATVVGTSDTAIAVVYYSESKGGSVCMSN